MHETFPGDFTPFTPRELHLRNREKRWHQDQPDAQECPDPQDARECPDPQDTQEKHKSPPHQTPPHQKRQNKKKVKVVHSKEYKIRQPKKRPVVKKCLYCNAAWGTSPAYPGQETTRHRIAFLYIFFFML